MAVGWRQQPKTECANNQIPNYPIPNSQHMSQALLNSVAYSFLGIGILLVTFILVEVLTPKHNLRHEILENKNMAVAVLAGFFMLAVAIIIASAIH